MVVAGEGKAGEMMSGWVPTMCGASMTRDPEAAVIGRFGCPTTACGLAIYTIGKRYTVTED